MASGLNYAKAKRTARARQAIHDHPADDHDQAQAPAPPIRGWRTEWDGDPFPVTVTRGTPDAESRAA